MKALLRGGPANGRVISHPYLHIYRVPVPKPFELTTPLDAVQAAMNAEPNYDVADYEFTGHASVNLNGEVNVIIYEFAGME